MSSSTGSIATARPGRRRRLFRLFTETTTGAMYEASLPGLFDLIFQESEQRSITGNELSELALHLFRSGFAVGINRAGGAGPPRCFGLVIRGGAKPPIPNAG